MDHIIKFDHVTKRYGAHEVLSDVSCSIKKGEIFGLLGPSGAGKTTLIKILTGQIKHYLGDAEVLGMGSKDLSDREYEQMGMVLDDSGLYERLSSYDNLLLFARIHGIAKERIAEVTEYVQLQDAMKTPAGKLSKGMKQRLVFARAILHQPLLLFLDEPTSGLDPVTTAKVHDLIFELREGGATVFLTTHDMEEATKLCDNIALLNEGKIVEYGNPAEICRKHNEENKIFILKKDGSEVILPNAQESAQKIADYFEGNCVLSIHSSEPTLETVFITLTGRGLL
ncbi:MAG: ABC transporter ATP-binding protein [bacterium]|nr:ABC transporter ATP-binding protein [bacterium]